LDLVVSSSAGTHVWVADEAQRLVPLETPVAAHVMVVADLDNNGLVDLAGVAEGRVVRLTNKATRGYHFQIVRPRAQTAAGDQRINTFGIGGLVEVRSGTLSQSQVITGPVVHLGLGMSTT